MTIFRSKTQVNLERALCLGDRIGGHLVQGHVEETAMLARIERQENAWNLFVKYQSAYIIPKGSVTLNGISLTIQEVQEDFFKVQIIPETLKKNKYTRLSRG